MFCISFAFIFILFYCCLFIINYHGELVLNVLICRYYRMFEATQEGLGKNAPIHSIHGSLLAVGELLRLVEFLNL